MRQYPANELRHQSAVLPITRAVVPARRAAAAWAA